MTEVMTIEEMKKRYPDEWVLIGDLQKAQPSGQVLAGRVLAHSRKPEDLDEHIKAHAPGPLAIECFQEPPPATEYLL
jgi:hypothetical protein